jgi:hypothetical protein
VVDKYELFVFGRLGLNSVTLERSSASSSEGRKNPQAAAGDLACLRHAFDRFRMEPQKPSRLIAVPDGLGIGRDDLFRGEPAGRLRSHRSIACRGAAKTQPGNELELALALSLIVRSRCRRCGHRRARLAASSALHASACELMTVRSFKICTKAHCVCGFIWFVSPQPI